MPPGPTLRDLLRKAIDDRTGAPLRDIQARVDAEEAARPRGMSLNRTTASQILRGTYRGAPSAPTIRAIGWLAGVPDDVAFAAAGRPEPGPPLAQELPEGADTLDRGERAVVIDVIRILLTRRQESDEWKTAAARRLETAAAQLERIQSMLDSAENATAPARLASASNELAELAAVIHEIRSDLDSEGMS